MVLDSSAVVAIVLEEAEGETFFELVLQSARKLLSAVSRVEAGIVVESRKGPAAARKLDEFIETGGIRIVDFSAFHAQLALEAWRRFGKGNHPAALNFGDCCTYALCQATGEPLLAKGEDFSRTEVKLVRA